MSEEYDDITHSTKSFMEQNRAEQLDNTLDSSITPTDTPRQTHTQSHYD